VPIGATRIVIALTSGTQEFVGTAGSLWVTQAKITLKRTYSSQNSLLDNVSKNGLNLQ
jgi:hypothetical protein